MHIFEKEFADEALLPDQRGWSQEDAKFMEIVKSGISFVNGHFMIPLPLRHPQVSFPNNRMVALRRALYQKSKMLKDDSFKRDYVEFVEDMVTAGYASQVPDDFRAADGKLWYLPHHGVYNANKPGKIRVVYDCSAAYLGTSLNSELLQGPDLANSLVGVLIRFRFNDVAFMGDVEKMFFQVQVPQHQRSLLRFFWWPQGDLNAPLKEYHMNVHLFGAASSPSVVNFALRKVADDPECTKEVADTIRHNFYVDDCLRSVESPSEACRLIQQLRERCQHHGFRLHKFICNDVQVMNTIPKEEQSKEVREKDLTYDALPPERALGVKWDVQEDTLGFNMRFSERPLTRRGILSVISSLYDPLGLISPVIFVGKAILQELCRLKDVGWDDEIPPDVAQRWLAWMSELPLLAELRTPRCVKPRNFGSATEMKLVAFSDASLKGYGAVVYLRQVNEQGIVSVSFILGKSRIAPMKATTIPKLELTAALTSVKLAQLARRELMIDVDVIYYTDSTAVLAYITNDQQRWPIFVANRVSCIRKFSNPSQWHYIRSEDNPADQASRGLTAPEILYNSDWLYGPSFLTGPESAWPLEPIPASSDTCCTSEITIPAAESIDSPIHRMITHQSSWRQVKMNVAVFSKLRAILLARASQRRGERYELDCRITVSDVEAAEQIVLMWTQSECFNEEVRRLSETASDCSFSARGKLKRSSPLYRLNPIMASGLLCVGGRLRLAHLPESTKYPVILPKRHHVTTLIIRNMHENLGHVGRSHVLSALRGRYWIINANSCVREVLFKCVRCRRLQAPCQDQLMADLPECRVDDAHPPFFHTGLDYFGPFVIRERRSNLKRYGVLFTCMSSRAVHLEVANSLDADSCINAIRRFVARRGSVRFIYSDNGTNFVAANKELKLAYKQMDGEVVRQKLMHEGITWNFNPPSASHMGGAWERVIRTVRKILSGLLAEHGERLDSESLSTLMCEVEAIINSRPLTTVSSDPNDPEPLTPAHVLNGKGNFPLSYPGHFQREDVFLRRRWKRVQHLANCFWNRWRKEYLVLLQDRQKWNRPKRNLRVGDIVLVSDESP